MLFSDHALEYLEVHNINDSMNKSKKSKPTQQRGCCFCLNSCCRSCVRGRSSSSSRSRSCVCCGCTCSRCMVLVFSISALLLLVVIVIALVVGLVLGLRHSTGERSSNMNNAGHINNCNRLNILYLTCQK